MTIEWNPDSPPEFMSTIGQLMDRIGQIEGHATADKAIGAIMHHDSGEELTVFASSGRFWFIWTPCNYAQRGLGSFHSGRSLGPPNQWIPPNQDDLVSCFLFGHHGELDLRDAVDRDSGRATIAQFYSSPERPGTVAWIPD